MAQVVLVTGGARSGKSSFAETLAKTSGVSKAYLATAPVLDEEMAARVAKHRELRSGDGWTTVEEPFDLAGAINRCSGSYDVVLIDCLTLWINNLLYRDEQTDEAAVKRLCDELKNACDRFDGTVVMVINEVGLGIVPDNPLSRRFRDLSGRCSQSIAAWADRVFLICCGLPLQLK